MRVDGWIETGSEVTAFYDPMVAKLIVHGETRDAALAKLQQALDATQLHGIATNLDYLRQIVATDAFRSGNVWTRFLTALRRRPASSKCCSRARSAAFRTFPAAGLLGHRRAAVRPDG